MAQILKFPAQASKLGFKRVKKRSAEHPDQLNLFQLPSAQILSFVPGLSSFEQALMLDERGDAKAAEFYARAIEEQDCVADACCNLGIIESAKGNAIKAFDCFTISLTHNPRHTEAHYNLANLYFDKDDFRLAQNHYEMAGKLDPGFANVYFNLALIHLINNDLDAAISSLGKFQGLVPEDEGRNAEKLLEDLKKSLAAARNSQVGAS